MNYTQTFKPQKLNVDKSPKYLDETESYFMLNHEVSEPSVMDKAVPLAGNYLACDMELGAGENYNNGRYYSPITNETYWTTYNSNGVNFIGRMNGDGVCEIVYSGDCLILNPEPQHEITKFRMKLRVEKVCHNRAGKQLIWVDGTDTPIGQIDVEASIATNFFTTPFFDVCGDECAPLQMCVPEPRGCLKGEYVSLTDADKFLPNNIIDKGIKVMYKYVYYDLRQSEWSDRSTLYYQSSRGCFFNTDGLSRCIKFRLPIGNPLVDTILFSFSEDGGATWFVSEIINKYKEYNSSSQMWYDRELTETISATYSAEDCSFDYYFCNDKQRVPVSPNQVSREINPMPRGAQGIVTIGNSEGFYNYKQGNCPVSNVETDKFTVSLNCDEGGSCFAETRTLKVRAIIHSTNSNTNQFVWRSGGAINDKDDVTDVANFGGFENSRINAAHNQKFAGVVRDFIIYVEGENYFSETTQFQADVNFVGTNLTGVLAGATLGASFLAEVNDVRDDGGYYYQEATINIPKGMSGTLRICSHHATGLQPDTSTQVIGVIDDIRNYVLDAALIGFHEYQFEIPFSCTDTELFTSFIIDDTVRTDTGGNHSSVANEGYIKDKDGTPLEGLEIWATRENTGGADDVNHVFARTDYNGYYFLYNWVGKIKNSTAAIYGELSCSGWSKIQSIGLNRTQYGQTVERNATIASTIYLNNFYANVYAKVIDCNHNPVPGVRVSLSGSKSKITNASGVAIWKIRNYKTRDRIITATVMSRFGCYSIDCFGTCNPCAPSTTSATPVCYSGKPTLNLTNLILSTESALKESFGLKHGGRYPFAIVLQGDCGRQSAAYPLEVNDGYIDVPRVQQSGSLGFCSFSFNANDMKLDDWVTDILVVRGANLKPYDLQWVVDDFKRTPDNKIVLTIQSLNDWNAKYNFKSNTVYQYLKGDRVEFIRNGDGKVFDTKTYGVLNYLTISPFNDVTVSGVSNDVNYFNQLIIEDDGKLGNLVKGAIIELQTPQEATTDITYFGICVNIPVTNGELQYQTGTFNTFDTYLVSRQIGVFSEQIFESKTPSDFWGGGTLDDTGKPYFANKYENERRYGRNITLNSATQSNYFGDFVKTFDSPEQGDIIALSVKDDKVGLGISEKDNFLFAVSDQLLRVSSNNTIVATTADSFISNPEAKLRGKYGCAYGDIGSIYFGDGYATYIDANNSAYVVHNYQLAKEAGLSLSPKGEIESSCSSYFRKVVTDKENFNKAATDVLSKLRYTTGFNKSTNKVYLTVKSFRNSGIFNSDDIYSQQNKTIIYNPINDTFNGFTSFTGEGYSELVLNNDTGCAMVSFQNSLPYIHPVVSSNWNFFYGIPCDWIVGIVKNKYSDKIKILISYELQSDKMFYVKKVTTDKVDFISEVPAKRVHQQQQNKWDAAFLNNVNSRGGLYNGENARGYVSQILFIRDNTVNLEYGSIDNNKRIAYSELDNILIKFTMSESSGFTNDL